MRSTDNTRAAMAMLGSAACFAGMNATAKQLALDGVDLAFIMFARCVFAVPPVLGYLWITRRLSILKTDRPHLHVLRGGASLIALATSVIAVSTLQLADATTLLASFPLILAVASGPILGERLNLGQWLAVLVGFAGVAIIARPTGAGLRDWPTLVALAGAVAIAAEGLIMRHMSNTEPPLRVTFYFMVIGSVATFTWVVIVHSPYPVVDDLPLLLLIGAEGTAAQLLLALAFTRGEAVVVAPLQFASVIFAAGLAVVVFNEALTVPLALGAVLIAGAGIYVVRSPSPGKAVKHGALIETAKP